MNSFKNYWWLILALVVTSLILIVAYKGVIPELEWKQNWSNNFGPLFAKLFVVTALLDQFVAVFFPISDDVKIMRRKTIASLKAQNNFRERIILQDVEGIILKKKVNEGSAETTSSISMEEINGMISNLENTKLKIDEERNADVRKYSFAAGLFLSVAGFSVLQEFIKLGEVNESGKVIYDTKDYIIYYADMILSAALISGGASGLTMFFQKLKDQISK